MLQAAVMQDAMYLSHLLKMPVWHLSMIQKHLEIFLLSCNGCKVPVTGCGFTCWS